MRSGRVLRRLDAENLYLGPEPFSPSGDRMVFSVGNHTRLALLDVASGVVQRRGGSQAFPVSWAPAGERLAADAQEGVIVSDEQQRFGPPQVMPEEESVELIRWSPDGTMLALMIREYRHDRSKLVVMPVNPAPGPTRIVIPYRASGLGGIQWSPDSRRIAYVG